MSLPNYNLPNARIRGHGMVAFMDVFQGAYKNGSEGTHDWRFMSGAYFLLRILILAVSSSVGSVARTTSFRVFIPVFIASALVLAIARPYKSNVHSIIDSLVLAVIALNNFFYLSAVSVLLISFTVPVWLLVMVVFTLLAPLLLLGGFVCYARKRYFLSISKKLKRVCSSADEPNSDMEPLETLTVCDLDYRNTRKT